MKSREELHDRHQHASALTSEKHGYWRDHVSHQTVSGCSWQCDEPGMICEKPARQLQGIRGASMEYTELGSTGMRVPRICLGTWAFGGEWGKCDIEASKATIRKALDLGITFFDTEASYGFGVTERILYDALRSEMHTNRERLVLATKGGLRITAGRVVRDSSKASLRQGLESSLRWLGVDYVDLYLIHWPDPNTPMDEVVETLSLLVDEGKTRFIGGSNFSLRQMQAFEQLRHLDAIQPSYHMFRRGIENTILPFCQERHIGVQAYGPLAHGLLSGRLSASTTFPASDWRSKSDIFIGETLKRNLRVVDQLRRIADQRHCALPQLAVAYVLAQPAIDCVAVGALTSQEISETSQATDVHLTRTEMNRINQVLRQAVSVGGPSPEVTFTVAAESDIAASESQEQIGGAFLHP